ncbi:MAG: HlyC/CorC family transporter [Acidobacteria bacterium]|nr:MAG: HlyC/CorC family transporter [Acidobacteriota bacterium]
MTAPGADTVATAAWAVALAAALLVYWLLCLAISARLVAGRLAAARIGSERGLRVPFDPGTRVWIAAQVLRQLALVAVVLCAVPLTERPLAAAALAGVVAVLAGRILQDSLPGRAAETILDRAVPGLRAVDATLGRLVAPLARLHATAETNGAEGAMLDEERREEQLEELIQEGEESGLFEREQGELVREIADLGTLIAREAMTPRTDLAAVDAAATCEQAARAMIASMHSRLPVYENDLDHMVGVVSVRDILPCLLDGPRSRPVRELMRPVLLVPETKRALDLLRELQREQQQLAVVVDEYGGTAGVVTIEDLVEEIVGEIHDEHEIPEREVESGEDGAWSVDGLMTVEDLEDLLGIDIEDEGIETVGGLLFSRLGRLPRAGDRVRLEPDVELEVSEMRGRRVARVRVVRTGGVPTAREGED